MTDSFVEGNHPGAYDFRGNFQGNLPEGAEEYAQKAADAIQRNLGNVVEGAVVEPAVSPSAALAPAEAQVHPVASESAGYKAPRGLTREEIRSRIRSVRPYSSVTVDVPEWDITVEVRSMSLGDRNDMALSMAGSDADNRKKFYPMVIATCSFDANGEKIWDETDVAWLNSLDAAVLDKIAEPAMKLNGLLESDKKVEEEAGKSSETESSESASS